MISGVDTRPPSIQSKIWDIRKPLCHDSQSFLQKRKPSSFSTKRRHKCLDFYIRYQNQIITLLMSAIADVGGPGWAPFLLATNIFGPSPPLLRPILNLSTAFAWMVSLSNLIIIIFPNDNHDDFTMLTIY